MICTRIGTIVKQQAGKIKAIKVTCRSWSCESCQKDRTRRLMCEAREGEPERFITLTVNPHWFDSPLERAQKLVAAWRLIRRRFLKLRKGAVVEFLAVFERTGLGEPHLHIVQRGSFMPQKWLSQQLEELIGAKVVDIRYIRDKKKVAFYIAKYIGKEPRQFGTLKRYWRSLKYLAMTAKEKKRLRNAGARFYLLDCHWKGYHSWIMEHCEIAGYKLTRNSFEIEWPDDTEPPWCLTVAPIIPA